MNTFFFGYLSLKWRRLVRTIWFFLWVISLLIFEEDFFIIDGTYDSFKELYFKEMIAHISVLLVSYFFPIAIISWVTKPFINKS